ncbi:LysR family transcriptional regulator [Tropicimonas sediminicola]|uniref:Transcriptional regulator, LysR family n=1 Tax=Tropicimonas sediminicola TaxID=1031541 RepID=A0A239CEE4_9RHOB|nr:LysR family transcriptional regulator [Tropicimonas sediminicola]SNS17713.1 transcriptional regulator, LysR family [Tropicimonas sediminicola]
MPQDLSSLDWSRVQSFLAVADTGSLSGAARELGLSQPTLGRQIRTLEEALGVTLFTRQPRGLALTEAGQALVPPARAMREAAQGFALTAAGRVDVIAGTVRVAASDVVALHVLPEILAGIRRAEPEIEIEILPSDRSANLLFREADIALRMYRPDQLDMVTRHLGDVPLGLYGARSYLDRRGRPERLDDIRSHDLIGYDSDETLIRGMRALGLPVDRHWFALRCDDHNVLWQLVRAGCGLCFAQVPLAEADATVQRLLPELPLPTLPIWLTAHEAMRRTPRIRRVWDLLADGLGRYLADGN